MATTALLNDGYLRLYTGPRPAAPEAPLTTQLMFVEVRFGSPAFRSPVNGVATANPFAGAGTVLLSGTPIWFRALASDGTTAVFDGDVGEDLLLSLPSLAAGGTFSVTSLMYSRP